ncbi:MAG: DUF5074 domain-containing protein [Muribaculaceae bacterium]
MKKLLLSFAAIAVFGYVGNAEVLTSVGSGDSQASLTVTWGDQKAIDNLSIGVNFDDGATVADIVTAALAGDARLYALRAGSDYVAFGFDTDGNFTSTITLDGAVLPLVDGVSSVSGDYTAATATVVYDHWQLNSAAMSWQVFIGDTAASWSDAVSAGDAISLVYTARGAATMPARDYVFDLRPADQTGIWFPENWTIKAVSGEVLPMLINCGSEGGYIRSCSFTYTDGDGATLSSPFVTLALSNPTKGNAAATVSAANGIGVMNVTAKAYFVNSATNGYVQAEGSCELTVAVDNLVTDIIVNGYDDGQPIELEAMGVLAIPELSFEPADADLQVASFSFSDPEMVTTYYVGSNKVTYLVAHKEGSCTMTITSGDGNATKDVTINVKGYEEPLEAGYDTGLLWLNEEWFTHTSGSINYIDADRDVHYRAYEAVNEGRAFGATSQYATVWADKLIVMSKQAWDGGDTRSIENNGGRVVIADAKTLERIASFDNIGGDGRACAGVSPSKVYLTHAAGVRVLDLNTMTIADADIEGLPVGSSYSGQYGNITVSGNRAFVAVQSKGIVVINTDTDCYESIIENSSIASVVTTPDGMVWYAAGTEAGCIDPVTLQVTRTVTLPVSVSAQWGTWRNVSFFASPNSNELLFNAMGGWSATPNLYRWNIDEVDDPSTLEPIYTYSGSSDYGSMYGCSGYDPRSDEFVFATSLGYGYLGLYNWLHFVDAKTGEVKAVKTMPEYWWFPAMPVLPDSYSAKVDIEDLRFEVGDTDARSFELAELTHDADDIDGFISVTLVDGSADAAASAEIADGVLTITPLHPGVADVVLQLCSRGRVSEQSIRVEVVAPQAATPSFSLAPGSVLKGSAVTIACDTEGAAIYYTTDGSEPTEASSLYDEAIIIDSDMTLRAIAVADGYDVSDEAVAEYTLLSIEAPTSLYLIGHIDNTNFNPTEALLMTKEGDTFSFDGEVNDCGNGMGYFAFADSRGSWDEVNAGVRYGAAASNLGVDINTDMPLALYSESSFEIAAGYYHFEVAFTGYEVIMTVTEAEGVSDVHAIEADAAAEFYTLQGVRVASPQAGHLYVVRRANGASKVYVK